VRVAAAPARIEDGSGKQERGGACEEKKGSGEERALHGRAESGAEGAKSEWRRRKN